MSHTDEQTNNTPPGLNEREKAEIRACAGKIRACIAAAARRAGRPPEAVTLVAVTKTYPLAVLLAALEAGLDIFGESRIQEALPKIEAIGTRAEWHLIGHLQRNKVDQAVGKFALIHSVDSLRLIQALEAQAKAMGVTQRILLQLNVSGEKSKYGALPEALPALLEALERSPHLSGEGLMTIPPYDPDPEASRRYFRRLKEILAETGARPRFTPRHLSMGMSGDFETAVEEGATLVRVGSAIFGERAYI